MNKINQIAFNLYQGILRWLWKSIQVFFIIEATEISKEALVATLSAKTGLNRDRMSLYDRKYFITDWETWGNIIDYDILDEVIYQSDRRDCDNFAYAFAALASVRAQLNTCGVAVGDLFNLQGEKIGRHCWNVIVTDKETYCYEPMTDGQTTIQPGLKVVIGNWQYVADYLIFF